MVERVTLTFAACPDEGGDAVSGLREAVQAARDPARAHLRYDLASPARLDCPLIEVVVRGRSIITNATAAYLVQASKTSVFATASRDVHALSAATGMAHMELSLLEQAADLWGDDILMVLSKSSAHLRTERIQRLELLRCIGVHMSRQRGSAAVGQELVEAVASLRLPRLKQVAVQS